MSVWDISSLLLLFPISGISREFLASMGLILDLSPRTLEKVLYFAYYIVLDQRYNRSAVQAGPDGTVSIRKLDEKLGSNFRVGMGAEAIKELLEAIDLEKESVELKKELEGTLPVRSVPALSNVWKS